MPLTHFNTQNSTSSLALLICHLFISGNFRTLHTIFDSTLITNQLLIDLNLNCPTNIPTITFAITSIQPPALNQSERTDHILQLTFLDRFNGSTSHLRKFIVFYQIYIISDNGIGKEDFTRNIEEIHSGHYLIFLHNPSFDTNKIYSGSSEQPIYVTNHSSIENIFQQTFGKLQSLSIFSAQYTLASTCNSVHNDRRLIFAIIQQILANYYKTQLNITYFEGVTTICGGGLNFHYARHYSQGVYKELFFESEPLNNETIQDLKNNENYVVQLVFDAFIHFFVNDSSKLSPLYPYDSTKIKVILLYGNDYCRLLLPPGLLDIISIGQHWFLFVWFVLSTVALYLIRLVIGSEQNNIYSSAWSMLIVWISGGKLHYSHRIEGFFLVMMLFAAFFVKSFGVGNFKSDIVIKESNDILTFQELAKTMDRPVYLNHVFHDKEDAVLKLLGNVLGRSITTAEIKYIEDVVRIPQSSLFVTVDYAVSYVELAAENQKDIDIIHGSLGEFNNNYFLKSKFYIPKRITDKFDRVTGSMLENGLHQFYWKFTTFLLKIRGSEESHKVDRVGEEFCKISLNNFHFPLLIYVSLMTLATIVFAMEVLYAYFKKV